MHYREIIEFPCLFFLWFSLHLNELVYFCKLFWMSFDAFNIVLFQYWTMHAWVCCGFASETMCDAQKYDHHINSPIIQRKVQHSTLGVPCWTKIHTFPGFLLWPHEVSYQNKLNNVHIDQELSKLSSNLLLWQFWSQYSNFLEPSTCSLCW